MHDSISYEELNFEGMKKYRSNETEDPLLLHNQKALKSGDSLVEPLELDRLSQPSTRISEVRILQAPGPDYF